MEIHPRTVAATYRSKAADQERSAQALELGDPERLYRFGIARGLQLAADDMDRRADAEFERIMAERVTGYAGAERMPDPTGIDCAEAHEGIEA